MHSYYQIVIDDAGHVMGSLCINMFVMLHCSYSKTSPIFQSEIACERPGVLDVLYEGVGRLVAWSPGAQTTRLLPVWRVAGPAVLHGLLHYILTALAQYTVVLSIRADMIDEEVKVRRMSSNER